MHAEMSITFEGGAYEVEEVMGHHEVPWGKEQIQVEYYVKWKDGQLKMRHGSQEGTCIKWTK